MMLKVTLLDGRKILIGAESSIICPDSDTEYTTIFNKAWESPFAIKETIKEIEQQIKEGGICGSNN